MLPPYTMAAKTAAVRNSLGCLFATGFHVAMHMARNSREACALPWGSYGELSPGVTAWAVVERWWQLAEGAPASQPTVNMVGLDLAPTG